MTQQPLCRLDKTHVLAIMLAAASVEDLVLTVLGLQTQRGARELNPLAVMVLSQGVLAALVLKVLALGVTIFAARSLARKGHAKLAQRTLVVWLILFVSANTFSAIQLVGGL